MPPDPRTPVPPHIHELDTLRALWVPTWYDLDHEIALGWQDSLRFFVTPDPDVLQMAHNAGKGDFDAILFTGLASSGPWFTLFGTVTSIQHAQLGPIQSIFSNGLDYTVVPVEGPPFIVNAEEQPGTVWDAVAEKWIEPSGIPHWIMEVTILLDYQTPQHRPQQTTPQSLNLETLIASSRPASTQARPPGVPPSKTAHPSFTLTPDRALLRGHPIARAALILYFVTCLAAGIVTNSSYILFGVMAMCALVSSPVHASSASFPLSYCQSPSSSLSPITIKSTAFWKSPNERANLNSSSTCASNRPRNRRHKSDDPGNIWPSARLE